MSTMDLSLDFVCFVFRSLPYVFGFCGSWKRERCESPRMFFGVFLQAFILADRVVYMEAWSKKSKKNKIILENAYLSKANGITKSS